MLHWRRVHRASKLIVLLAATLVAANAQCVMTCTFEECGPTAPPHTHCHHESTPDKGTPVGKSCSHELSFVDAKAKAFDVGAAHAFVAEIIPVYVTQILRWSPHYKGDHDISPPVPPLSSISILRI